MKSPEINNIPANNNVPGTHPQKPYPPFQQKKETNPEDASDSKDKTPTAAPDPIPDSKDAPESDSVSDEPSASSMQEAYNAQNPDAAHTEASHKESLLTALNLIYTTLKKYQQNQGLEDKHSKYVKNYFANTVGKQHTSAPTQPTAPQAPSTSNTPNAPKTLKTHSTHLDAATLARHYQDKEAPSALQRALNDNYNDYDNGTLGYSRYMEESIADAYRIIDEKNDEDLRYEKIDYGATFEAMLVLGINQQDPFSLPRNPEPQIAARAVPLSVYDDLSGRVDIGVHFSCTDAEGNAEATREKNNLKNTDFIIGIDATTNSDPDAIYDKLTRSNNNSGAAFALPYGFSRIEYSEVLRKDGYVNNWLVPRFVLGVSDATVRNLLTKTKPTSQLGEIIQAPADYSDLAMRFKLNYELSRQVQLTTLFLPKIDPDDTMTSAAHSYINDIRSISLHGLYSTVEDFSKAGYFSADTDNIAHSQSPLIRKLYYRKRYNEEAQRYDEIPLDKNTSPNFGNLDESEIKEYYDLTSRISELTPLEQVSLLDLFYRADDETYKTIVDCTGKLINTQDTEKQNYREIQPRNDGLHPTGDGRLDLI
ncbi:hypothetical protein IKF15_03790 [Candidatus Saccharibacteria bacterium]|nr:hypothetical protein [Candidatus Saccharibacteria bacterium]